MGLNTFRYQFVVPLDPPQTDPSKFEADEDERGTERTTKTNIFFAQDERGTERTTIYL